MRRPFRGVLNKSFLERSPRIIGLIAILVVAGGSLFALLLTGGVFADTYRVTAQFVDAAGIEPGDEVTVAGLDAGSVKGLSIEDGMVAVELAINRGIELSRDATAEVVVETILGKKSINLADGASRELLAEGDVIAVERTVTPVEVNELNDIQVRLLNASDADALETFLAELTAITDGKSVQVRDIAVGLSKVSEAIDSRRDELSRLITSLRTLFTTLGEKDDTIVSLIDNLDIVLGNLANRQEAIQLLLVATDSASHETADLVGRNRQVLDATLAALHTDLTVLNRHQLDLAATITYLEQAVQGYSSVGYSQGVPNRWANIFVQSLGPLGVDAIVGECGAVDQLIDSLFGTSCEESGDGDGDEGIEQVPGGGGGSGSASNGEGSGSGDGSGGDGSGSGDTGGSVDADGDGLTDGLGDLMDDLLGGDDGGGLP